MFDNQTQTDTPEVWDQILHEARELRDEQNARLVSAQRQSQVIFTGLLAVTALLLTAASIYFTSRPRDTARSDAPLSTDFMTNFLAQLEFPLTDRTMLNVGGSLIAGLMIVNSYVWFSVHRRRGWRETLTARDLRELFDRRYALVPLRRNLVQRVTIQIAHNKAIADRALFLVRLQAGVNFAYVCGLVFLLALSVSYPQ
ncbi:MAG: hypothetical protein F4118_11325 [Acidimicrobiaceae bacterium]|nr:hypothetical protein [Acidimicrobiaceae bacterium]MYI36998.1 hypothetical protein [Acidimicrobiaceae bacterium]